MAFRMHFWKLVSENTLTCARVRSRAFQLKNNPPLLCVITARGAADWLPNPYPWLACLSLTRPLSLLLPPQSDGHVSARTPN